MREFIDYCPWPATVRYTPDFRWVRLRTWSEHGQVNVSVYMDAFAYDDESGVIHWVYYGWEPLTRTVFVNFNFHAL